MERLLFTAEEVAEILHIGRCKVFELMRSGELRSVKLGGSRRVPREALTELVGRLAEGSLT